MFKQGGDIKDTNGQFQLRRLAEIDLQSKVIYWLFFFSLSLSRRHNPLWVCIHSPLAGFSLLFRGFYITHNDAPQSVGLLRTSNQFVAETST